MWCWWKKCTSCTSTNLPTQQVWGMFLVNDTFISCQRCDETTVIKELLNQLELCTATVWVSKHHAVDDGHDSICHRIFTCQGNTICVWKPWCFKSLIVTKTSCINDGYFCGFIFALESEHWLYCRQIMVFKLFFFHSTCYSYISMSEPAWLGWSAGHQPSEEDCVYYTVSTAWRQGL